MWRVTSSILQVSKHATIIFEITKYLQITLFRVRRVNYELGCNCPGTHLIAVVNSPKNKPSSDYTLVLSTCASRDEYLKCHGRSERIVKYDTGRLLRAAAVIHTEIQRNSTDRSANRNTINTWPRACISKTFTLYRVTLDVQSGFLTMCHACSRTRSAHLE